MHKKPHYKRKFFSKQYVKHEKRSHMIWAALLFGSLVVFVYLSFYIFGMVIVHGKSMEPAFKNGHKLFLHKWVYLLRDPKPGEIVVFKDPEHPKFRDVKRVIAGPGSVIQIYGGEVYVDGTKLNEYYLRKGTVTVAHRLNEKRYEVASSSYFLMGDNREYSIDSRDFGAIKRNDIKGKIYL